MRSPIFQILSRITIETNSNARLFEPQLPRPPRESVRSCLEAPSSVADGARRHSAVATALFFARIATHQFALSDRMTFQRRVQLAPLRAER